MPAKHPGVIQFEFCGRTIYIPAVTSIELLDLQQAVIQFLLRAGKTQVITHRLYNGCEQNPVVCICALAVYLSKPGDDLKLLHRCHLVEDPLPTHPECNRNICAFDDPLVHVTNVAPVGSRIGGIGSLQEGQT